MTVRRSTLSTHCKAELRVCSQALATSHPEELWIFQEEEGNGREIHLVKRRRRTTTSPVAPPFGWCRKESNLHFHGEEEADLSEESQVSGWGKTLKWGVREGFERKRVLPMILNQGGHSKRIFSGAREEDVESSVGWRSERRNELEVLGFLKVENQVRFSGLQADSGAEAQCGERRKGGLSRLCKVWASSISALDGVEFC